MNQAVKFARGEWIARLDSDDLAHPTRLLEQYAYVKKYPEIVLLGTGCNILSSSGYLRGYFYPKSHLILNNRLKRLGAFFPHSSVLFRKKSFTQVGGYRKRFLNAQDLDLWLRLARVGKLGAVNKSLVTIRDHENRLSNFDGGSKQMVFARVVLINYWISIFSKKDFSDQTVSDHQFLDFFKNVEDFVKTDRYYREEKKLYLVKSMNFEKSKLYLMASLLKFLFVDPYFMKHLFYRLFFGEKFLKNKAKCFVKYGRFY